MSCCRGSVAREARPGTARVLVTELSDLGSVINPTPVTKPCEDSAESTVEPYLSREKLIWLCGTHDLSNVTSLEICVNTQENTLGNFAVYLPRLAQLKMNNSIILSTRDLGTTLSHLQVLWMSRCCLQDIDGISTFSCLKELYLGYNNVSELSQIGMLENLQLLDLEGNDVDDLVQIQYLGLCSKLQTLTLEGNPVCLRPNPTSAQTIDYSYRAAIRELVPQLHYLDDVKVEEDKESYCSTNTEEWDILKNSIRDWSHSAVTDEETEQSSRPQSSHSSPRCPSSTLSHVWLLSSVDSRSQTGTRLMSASRSGVFSSPRSRPGSADSDLAAVEPETSVLTHGAGKILFCGNPVQAVRARREKLQTAPTRSNFIPRDVPIHVPEHTYDLEEHDPRERASAFAELKAWRKQYSRRLQAIEKERLPQVLTIQHSDDEESFGNEEEEGFYRITCGSSDEENEDGKCYEGTDMVSPDSAFQSLSPDLHLREASSPDIAHLSLASDTKHSPSPPPTSFGGATAHTETVRQRATTRVPQPTPPSKELCFSLSSGLSSHKHERSQVLHRPAIARPHTARAALQKHHQHHIVQPCRGSSHPA
ncbi:leucine-rich repeat-containing protein 56 [Pholidichthys leucotaenia]